MADLAALIASGGVGVVLGGVGSIVVDTLGDRRQAKIARDQRLGDARIAREERFQEWRQRAANRYVGAVLHAYRSIETTAKWLEEDPARDVSAEIEEGRVAGEERWAAFGELMLTGRLDLGDWFKENYSEEEKAIEEAFWDAYDRHRDDFSFFLYEAGPRFRDTVDLLIAELRTEVHSALQL
jgi:hypothetical protein